MLRALGHDTGLAARCSDRTTTRRRSALVSEYRNLLHHFVHQMAREESDSFWAGCGAIRRPVFLALGGFDER